MIVALRRDGVAASVSAMRKRTLTMNQSSRNMSYALITQHHFPKQTLTASLRLTLIENVRPYSTSLPPTDKTNVTTPLEPLSPVQQRVRKVELRPAPVKPQPASPQLNDSAGPSRRAADNARVHGDPTPKTAPNSSPTPSTDGVISTAKHDMEEAAQHGILAPPPENASKIGKLIHQAKELFKFYWRGLKLINTNRKRVREMEERVKNGGPALTRWEHKFIRTYKEDALKLIPFALLIIIAEELIPLVVMYAPAILPSTCILPAQKERIDNNRREKQRAFASSMKDTFERMYQLGASTPDVDVKQLLRGPSVAAVSGILGHSRYSLDVLRIRKIRRHLAAVAEDDILLAQEGGGARLTPAEVVDALGERGLVAQGLSLQQQHSRLKWWLTQIESSSEAKEQSDPIARRLIIIAQDVAGRR